MIRILLTFAVILNNIAPAHAEDPAVEAWAKEKCVRYERAWNRAKDFVGPNGISREFIEGNEKFIADGCSSGADICPRSVEEIKLANVLTMAAMNFGTASSFLPFVCRQR
ncbi:hypothetical protein KX729_27840 [Rhizobium sp. XQZ8]|uniref:hypothetical protein n=1 Tax=Rhizobium populisoli TaxID=2859785 RepID=UPI001CA4E28E|nr:hypothetical protein [Rhizobium populisoli]MBW6425247.1 hypothetical protein [Rhizobium populisoli]